MLQNNKFKSRVALITGASSGLGEAAALEFAKTGYSVVVSARNEAKLQQTASCCYKESKLSLTDILVAPCDVTKEGDVKNLISKTIDHFGRLDVVVNSAGVLNESNAIESFDMNMFDSTMATNVKGSLLVIKHALQHLIQSKGCVVNISSISGTAPVGGGFIIYGISKAAVDHMTKCLALDLAHLGVRVNSVNPGVVDTGIHLKGYMNQEQYKEFLSLQPARHPIGRCASITDVTNAILFLASEESSFLTGVILMVDGGRSLTMAGYVPRKITSKL